MDQILDAAMPTPRVDHWMKRRLAACRLAAPVNLGGPNLAGGAVLGNPGLGQPPYPQPATIQSTYTILEIGKIQSACSLEDAEYETDRPDLYD